MRRLGFHLAVAGLIGVLARIVVLAEIAAGSLLYYSGPGSPYWLDEILLWGEIVPGAMLGAGFVLWLAGRIGTPLGGALEAKTDRTSGLKSWVVG